MKKMIKTIVMAVLCLNFNLKAQEPTKPPPLKNQAITGKVISASTGEALPGAIIKITNTNQNMLTNDKGEFSLTLPNGSYNLSVNYLSYKTKNLSIQVPLKEQLVISLDADDQNLQEVEINAGYYTVKDRDRTGSISRVTAETIAKQPVSNPLAALVGRMPGVNIEQSSGLAGGQFRVEIRGRNSLRGDAREPLYLIDGVPYPSAPLMNNNLAVTSIAGGSPLNYINTADIESIEVLKDADATAIYGSRGANGVVLIKTKGAKTGKTSVEVNAYSGIAKVARTLKLLNTQQYLEMRDEAFTNDQAQPSATDYDVNGDWGKSRYTNWQKVLTGGTAHTTTVQTTIGGGNEFTRISFRGNYSRQTTVFPGDFSDSKGAITLTGSHSTADKRFTFNFSSSYLIDNNKLPQFDLSQYITLAPNAPDLYGTSGDLNWGLNALGVATWTNPLAALRLPYRGKSNTSASNALLSYEAVPDLIFKSTFGYTNIRLKENLLRPLAAQNPSSSATGSASVAFNNIETWIIEPQVSYQKRFGSSFLSFLLGTTFQKDQQKAESITASGYTSDLLLESINAAPVKNGTSSESQYKYSAVFGRINYHYKDKYLINLTGRRDGSSRFGPGKKFANFGALGLAWIFSNEQIFKEVLPEDFFGKIRGSYGITGSDQIPNYGYLDTYSATYPYQDGTGLIPNRLANPDYSWESNRKMEAAIDLNFIKDRIRFSTGFYQNRSSNQLVGYPLPDVTGFPNIQYNLAATVQNSGWEFELSTVNFKQDKFTWSSSLNLSLPNNKLIAFPNLQGSSYASTYTIGHSLYAPIGFSYKGVDPQTGLYTFQDLDGNASDLDQADRKVAGKSLTSHAYGGLQNGLSYKGFSLEVFIQFAKKTARGLINSNAPGTMGNQQVKVMERWQAANQETDIQKFSQSSVFGGARTRYGYAFSNSDVFADASFIRLRNIHLAWAMPERWTQRLKLKSVSFYVQGQNLFTLTKYPADSETLNIRALPSLLTIVTGVSMTL